MNGLRMELIVFLYNIAGFLLMLGSGTLLSQKLCYPGGSPGVDVVCTDDQALKDIARLNQFKMNIKGLLPGVVVLFAGSWRDQTGLVKPLLVLAHLGDLAASLVELLGAMTWNSSLWFDAAASGFLSGITGSRQLLMMAAHIYISENTAPEQRASRLSLINVAIMSSICVGMASSGFLLSWFGFKAYFGIVLSLGLLSLALTSLLIQDGKRKEQRSSASLLSSLSRFKVMLQPKPNNLSLWLFLTASAINMTVMFSEMGVSQIFSQKQFQFTPKAKGLYNSYKMLLNVLISAVAIPMFKKIFKLPDFGILISGIVLTTISCLGLALSTDITLLYIFDALSVFRILVLATLKTFLTMCVKKSETGVYMSFLSFSEGILPILLSPMYTYVFTRTVETMPGAFFYISAAATILTGITVSIAKSYYMEIPEEEQDKGKEKQS